jgi:uncharacterized membrane protein YkoI
VNKTILTIACSVALTGVMAGCSTTSQEIPLQESQVPAPVLAAFHQQFPEAHILKHALEKKGSRDFYELETDGKGAPHSLIYTPAGELAETEVAISFTQLPVVVQEASKRASPTGQVELVEIAQKKGKTFYEVHFKENGRTLETMFDPAGTLVEKKYE